MIRGGGGKSEKELMQQVLFYLKNITKLESTIRESVHGKTVGCATHAFFEKRVTGAFEKFASCPEERSKARAGSKVASHPFCW